MFRFAPLVFLILAQDPDINALLKQLEDDSIEVREKAASSLVELGAEVEDRLKKEAATAQGEKKSRIDSILVAIGNRRRLATVLPPLRRVTLEAADRPLKEVLAEFKARTGVSLRNSAIGEGKVSVQIRDASPLEALDAICKAARVGYVFNGGLEFGLASVSEPGELVIEGSYAEFPRTFAGRYGICASSLSVIRTTDFEKATGGAGVDVGICWLPEVCPGAPPVIELVSATDDLGASLKSEEKVSPSDSIPLTTVGRVGPHRAIVRVGLKSPTERATKIVSLKGRLKMSYLVERYATFESTAGDQKLEYDGVTLELKDFKHDGEEVRFNLDISGRRRQAGPVESRWCQDGKIRIDGDKIALKAEGDAECRPSEWGGGATETGWRMNFTFRPIKSKVTAVKIEVDGLQLEDVVNFELKDIPLPK